MVVPKFKIREAYGYILLKLEERGAYSLNFTQILGQMIFLKKKKKEKKITQPLNISLSPFKGVFTKKFFKFYIKKKSASRGN